LEIGKYNRLKIIKAVNFGLYLDGKNGEEILLPTRYVPPQAKIGDEIEDFLYNDNEGRPIATTEHPYGTVGEFRYLKVKEISDAGAFLDWGIMKDLLVPYREQKIAMKAGEYYPVYIYSDFITRRIVASARIDKFLDNLPPDYQYNQEVDLLITDETDLGYKAIINNQHWGLLYKNELFETIKTGERRKGYIREVREDDKIDLRLFPSGYDKIEGLSKKIMSLLAENNGYLHLNDKSEASEIHTLLSCSKKSFKKAVGTLYRQRLITIEECGIRAID
jgi:predicted RNA-binding protein (virulence factor B family)